MRPAGLLCLVLAVGGWCAGQDTNFPVGPQYLITTDSMFLHNIATPTLSLGAPLPEAPAIPETAAPVENQTYGVNPALAQQADLFPIYYGYPRVSEVELTSPEETTAVPGSITGVVSGFTSTDSLRELGYGIPLGDAASYWKAHRTTPHVYTNADIQRLHPK